MTLTLYISKCFENTIKGERVGAFLGVSVHLPCLVVYLCDNRIKICCKLSPLSLIKHMTGKLPSFSRKLLRRCSTYVRLYSGKLVFQQWNSLNAEKVTHIKGRLLDQATILFNYVPFQNENFS